MESAKKEFDQTVCFTFFSDWLEIIENVETDADKESIAYMLFKSIANYALYDTEPCFEKSPATQPFRPFWPMIARQIKGSINNRKRGFLAPKGPTENAKKVIETYKQCPSASVRDVSNVTGVSKSEVSRVKNRYIDTDDDFGSVVPAVDVTATNAGSYAGSYASSHTDPYTGDIPAPTTITDTNTNTGKGHGTGRDTGQNTGQQNVVWDFIDIDSSDGSLPF